MSRILKVSNGDYKLQVQSGGNIILDTQSTTGTVTVIGNLDVQGTTSYIESVDTQIKDNILQLNYGQTGAGISSTKSYQAGIEILRGNRSSAQFLFNEQVPYFNPVNSSQVNGAFVLKTIDGQLSGLQLRTIATDGTTDFAFDMQNSNYALLIANSTSYETKVTKDNHILNRKYLYNYVAASNGIATVDRLYTPQNAVFGSEYSKVQAFSSSINMYVGGNTIVTVSAAGMNISDLNFFGDTITNNSISQNLVFAAANNNVEVNAILNLDDQSSTPSQQAGRTKLYSKATAGPGNTGLYISNVTTQDELVSKNRAVLLSILL